MSRRVPVALARLGAVALGLALALGAGAGRDRLRRNLRRVGSGALAGVAYLCRPEGLLLGAAVILIGAKKH